MSCQQSWGIRHDRLFLGGLTMLRPMEITNSTVALVTGGASGLGEATVRATFRELVEDPLTGTA